MGVKGTLAEVRARRLKEMLEQIERERQWKLNRRKEHRLKWRRDYYRKQRGLPPEDEQK